MLFQFLPGAIETLEAGITSSLHPQNLHCAHSIRNAHAVIDSPQYQLLFDPQTSGGLLASVPAEHADNCIEQLQVIGHEHSCSIGRVTSASEGQPITLNRGAV